MGWRGCQGKEGCDPAPHGFSALTSQPHRGGGVRTLAVTPLLRVWGLLLRASRRKPCPQEGIAAAGKTGVGPAALADRSVHCALSLHLPNYKETQQMEGEEETRAGPSLTVSVEFYPSPPGKPGRKEKEGRQVRTPWNVTRGEALSSKPLAVRRWRLGLCLLRIYTPKAHPGNGTRQGAGFKVFNSLSAGLQTKGSLVRFPVRAHERQPHIDVSLPLFLPPFPSL